MNRISSKINKVLSYVSDGCPNPNGDEFTKNFRCERPVSTIICLNDENEEELQQKQPNKNTNDGISMLTSSLYNIKTV